MSNKGLLDYGSTEVINPDTYFEQHEVPKFLGESERRVQEFVTTHEKTGKSIALITVCFEIIDSHVSDIIMNSNIIHVIC
jgi:hypothetical protein